MTAKMCRLAGQPDCPSVQRPSLLLPLLRSAMLLSSSPVGTAALSVTFTAHTRCSLASLDPGVIPFVGLCVLSKIWLPAICSVKTVTWRLLEVPLHDLCNDDPEVQSQLLTYGAM